jgi:hypothetical protein
MLCGVCWRIFVVGPWSPMFRDSLLVPSSTIKHSKELFLDCLTFEDGTAGRPETPVITYQPTPRKIPERRRRKKFKFHHVMKEDMGIHFTSEYFHVALAVVATVHISKSKGKAVPLQAWTGP